MYIVMYMCISARTHDDVFLLVEIAPLGAATDAPDYIKRLKIKISTYLHQLTLSFDNRTI